jgi:preprotein translocase subunit SecE
VRNAQRVVIVLVFAFFLLAAFCGVNSGFQWVGPAG